MGVDLSGDLCFGSAQEVYCEFVQLCLLYQGEEQTFQCLESSSEVGEQGNIWSAKLSTMMVNENVLRITLSLLV